ncbi:MAG: hypothetical protein LKJ67_08200 [Ancrocorticia sp.]|nr:hypothetical protein [Ancrocorticia sp.]
MRDEHVPGGAREATAVRYRNKVFQVTYLHMPTMLRELSENSIPQSQMAIGSGVLSRLTAS